MSQNHTQSVLLVEADPALRRVMSVGLRQQGVEVLEAASARQAQALLERNPALLILDIDSGLASDWSLLTTIRADDKLAQKPVVVLAWECLPEASDQNMQPNSTVCLVKPFDARLFLSEVETLLAALPHEVALVQSIDGYQETLTALPSLWPFVLAFGLVLAVSGLLVHIVLVVLGMVVAFGAMLLWGFEPAARPGEA